MGHVKAGNLQELPHPLGLVCLMVLTQVSVTPMMSGLFDETKSLKVNIFFFNDQAFNRQVLMFLTDGPRFKLMSR